MAKQAEIAASFDQWLSLPREQPRFCHAVYPILPLLNARNELERITKWPQFGAPLSIDYANHLDESSRSATMRSAAF